MTWSWFARSNPSPADAADEAAVRLHLQKILGSPEFLSATRLQQFLTYVVELKLSGANSVKETEVAMEVFHRHSSFDPSGDSVVRVAASNLRHRLHDYYLHGGAHDALRIELRKGNYLPVFQVVETRAPVPRRRRAWAVLCAISAAVVCAGATWLAVTWRGAPAPSSIAVLPFLNLSNTPDHDYLADGFVEELTTALAQVEGLKVVARSSAFQFKGKSPEIREAGRKLGVETVLEGSLRRTGENVRVNAQLIQVSDGFHMWSRSWEGAIADLPVIQADLTRNVAAVLRRPATQRSKLPGNAEAYDLYLKGNFFQERITPSDLLRSIGYLRQSVEKDPAFAPAHAALGRAYGSLSYHRLTPDWTVIAQAKQEARRSIELDPKLAEGHALLAWLRFFSEWNWAESEAGLRQALLLNPNSVPAHDWYAQRLMAEGRFDEALLEARKAQTLDPLNYRMSANVGIVLYCARRYDEAIRQARQALDLNPHFFLARTVLGVSLQGKKQYREAEVELRASLADNPSDADTQSHLAAVLLATGRREAALALIRSLEKPPSGVPVPWYELAYAHLVMGDTAGAFDDLDHAFAERNTDMTVLKVDPAFEALWRDPRFTALLGRMGLPR